MLIRAQPISIDVILNTLGLQFEDYHRVYSVIPNVNSKAHDFTKIAAELHLHEDWENLIGQIVKSSFVVGTALKVEDGA
jgi:hypothetical protein